MHMSDDIDVLQAATHDQRMEGAVFEPGAPPPQQVTPNWMEQCSSFMCQLEQHLALPCCYRELTEPELDQVKLPTAFRCVSWHTKLRNSFVCSSQVQSVWVCSTPFLSGSGYAPTTLL